MRLLKTALWMVLVLGSCSSLGASDYASQEEIQASLRQAMESLKSRDVETRLKGAQTVQTWARFAARFVPDLATAMQDPKLADDLEMKEALSSL